MVKEKNPEKSCQPGRDILTPRVRDFFWCCVTEEQKQRNTLFFRYILCNHYPPFNLTSMNDVILSLCLHCRQKLLLHLNLFCWFYEDDALKNLLASDMVQSTPIWVIEIIQNDITKVVKKNKIYSTTVLPNLDIL